MVGALCSHFFWFFIGFRWFQWFLVLYRVPLVPMVFRMVLYRVPLDSAGFWTVKWFRWLGG
jgi:hypothetical protein